MDTKKILIIATTIIVLIAIFSGTYVYLNQEPKEQTVMTPVFHFNISADENWTFNKDHDDGYSYQTDFNQTKIRFYTTSIEDMDIARKAINIGWKPINVSGYDDVLIYESHFDGENPARNSTFTYYSAFKNLNDSCYVHVASLNLNRTLDVINRIELNNN